MRIAYFDEAGVADEAQEPFTVVAGVLINGDTQWHSIEAHARKIIETLVPNDLKKGFFFSARRLMGNEFRELLTPQLRFQLLREVMGTIAQAKLPVGYGAVTRAALKETLEKDDAPFAGMPAERASLAHQWPLFSAAPAFFDVLPDFWSGNKVRNPAY